MAENNQSTKNMHKLSLEEQLMVSGGNTSDFPREDVIRLLLHFKTVGMTREAVEAELKDPKILEVIAEVWDTL